jgi:uncharacterized protein YjbI with pentapeptide repeats
MFILRAGRTILFGALISLLMSPAIAQEAGVREQLRMLGKCGDRAFQELDLSGRKLTAIDQSASSILRDFDFSEARLNIALFDHATPEGVSFDAADLTGASRVICVERQ